MNEIIFWIKKRNQYLMDFKYQNIFPDKLDIERPELPLKYKLNNFINILFINIFLIRLLLYIQQKIKSTKLIMKIIIYI